MSPDTPIGDLELSVRSVNCLRAHGFKTLGELAAYWSAHSKAHVLRNIKNFGAKSYSEVEEMVLSVRQELSQSEEALLWATEHVTEILAIKYGKAVLVPAFNIRRL